MTGMKLKIKQIVIISMVLVCAVLFSACMRSDAGIDPGDWGYDCCVTYDALGGIINSREMREVYYMNNSYLFQPSGTTNMLVEPVKDGYILAGWYTAKEDATDAEGNTVYQFSAEDRWDFDEDRIQENLTLYARWIPQGKVNYVNADTGEVVFSKNLTADSPVQELSAATLNLSTPKGYSFAGYYADAACTIPYDFTQYEHVELLLENEQIYAKLAERFPQYFEAAEYVAPEAAEEGEEQAASTEDTSYLYINKAGYRLLTDDPAALAEIRTYKDQIIEEAIEQYQANTASQVVYIKFTEGLYVRVTSLESLKKGGEYSFAGVDASGNEINGYILETDLDFSGVKLAVADSFNGTIQGNGHTIRNLTVKLSSTKIDPDKEKAGGIAARMDGAVIEGVVFEDCALEINVNSGIQVTAGFLAGEAKNTTVQDCTFRNLAITTGKGDDGAARYELGDLFGNGSGNKVNNCTAEGVTVTASDAVRRNMALQ